LNLLSRDARIVTSASELLLALLRGLLADAHDPTAIERWTALWRNPLVSALAAPGATTNGADAPTWQGTLLRQNILTYVLPQLIKVHATVLPTLLMALDPTTDAADRLRPASTAARAAPVQAHLHALLATLRLARSQGLLPADYLASSRVLRVALIHADPEIATAAATLVASAQKPREPVTDTEAALLRLFVEHNLTVAASDVRQRQATAMESLFGRLRDGSGGNFTPWLVATLLGSLYPGVPFQRATTALTWLAQLVRVRTMRDRSIDGHCHCAHVCLILRIHSTFCRSLSAPHRCHRRWLPRLTRRCRSCCIA